MRKTLIINGSPRREGDTAALIAELKKHLSGPVTELSAFYSNIAPCYDCRQCQKTGRCAIQDDMQIIYEGDYDNVVLAVPVYYRTVPGQVLSLMSRFQAYRSAKKHLADPRMNKQRKAGLILTAGGKGNERGAEHHVRVFFKMLNADGFEKHPVFSLHTDALHAVDDANALAAAKSLALWLEEDDTEILENLLLN